MKANELRNMSTEELQAKLKSLKEEQYKLTLQRYGGNVEKPHLFSAVKKDIARVLTILQDKKEKKNG
ncbi:MAG TPA: 50S ribosomal protein L29 [Candidatus Omnitrophota bacterium]|nr:50S ribosomal protein L29 [Candidatus Omnitrophota bacterium]HRZ15703.1 50S ribosomal protein L29 [Candidatus Omnitrophota bacterium]